MAITRDHFDQRDIGIARAPPRIVSSSLQSLSFPHHSVGSKPFCVVMKLVVCCRSNIDGPHLEIEWSSPYFPSFILQLNTGSFCMRFKRVCRLGVVSYSLMTAVKYTNPLAMGMYVVSSAHTWFARLMGSPRNR
jgi:hypothetical protein